MLWKMKSQTIMSVLDSKLGKADKEQVKLVSKKLTAKATQGALQDYAMDTKIRLLMNG